MSPEPLPRITILLAAAGWRRLRLQALLRRLAQRVLAQARPIGPVPPRPWGVTILLADAGRLRQLNHDFRGKDKATDVLAFPARDDGSGLLGEVVLGLGPVRAYAAKYRINIRNHAARLLVHALLHCLGYTHDTDADAKRMQREERRLLCLFGEPDPPDLNDA